MKTNNVKKIREKLGMSQLEFAGAIGVCQGNVSHYELQHQEVPSKVARNIIRVAHEHGLKITFNDIYISDTGIEQQYEPCEKVVIVDRRVLPACPINERRKNA